MAGLSEDIEAKIRSSSRQGRVTVGKALQGEGTAYVKFFRLGAKGRLVWKIMTR